MERRSLPILMLVLASLVIAILLATSLNSFTHVPDAALADAITSPRPSPLGEGAKASTNGKNYLPIILLGPSTLVNPWLLAGNAGTNSLTDFLGTTDNMTLTLRVSNTVAYRIAPAFDLTYGFAPNVIGGSKENMVLPGMVGATIGGGGAVGSGNLAGDMFTTIAGGLGNNTYGPAASVGGGLGNYASGDYATVGGGQYNFAGMNATVSGGEVNSAAGWAAIGGGGHNTANALYATIAGGYLNTATGSGAFIGGGGTDGVSNGGNRAQAAASVIGGGMTNTISATANYAFIGGGTRNATDASSSTIGGGSGNTANGTGSVIAGGISNSARGVRASIGGGISNLALGDNATIGGGSTNTANGAGSTIGGGNSNWTYADNATIGGGGMNVGSGTAAAVGGGSSNIASGNNAAIGGGNSNVANGLDSVIGGGYFNTANNSTATIGGGGQNSANGNASTISGGYYNTASGPYGAIGGGIYNIASGNYSTIPGGIGNSASMTYTFAAGRRAQAVHQGAFVWADSTNANFASTANDQFMIRAGGGVKILDGTSVPTSFIAAALQAENASTTGEAAWLRLGNAVDNSPVITLIKQDSGTGDFLRCYNETLGSYVQKCHVDSNGSFVSGSDFAESLRVVGDKASYAPGELIALSKEVGAVAKSSEAYARGLIGVYSTRPGFVGADKNGTVQVNADEIPVAITGIVPVKVSDENGAIAIGDALTSSSMPGVAMKATRAGKIVGYAMEEANGKATILALVQPGDYVPAEQLDALNRDGQVKNGNGQELKELTELKSEVAVLKGFVAIAVVAMVGLVVAMVVRRKR